MKNYYTAALSVLLGFSACTGGSGQKSTQDQNESFGNFEEVFLHEMWEQSPGMASWAGLHEYDSVLVANTPESRKATLDAMDSLRVQLEDFSLEQLSDLNKIDYHLMENYIESTKWYISTLKGYEWNPSNTNVGGSIWTIMNGTYADLNTRLGILSTFLSKVPAYYEAGFKNLKVPTWEHLELGILQNKGGLALFEEGLQDSIAQSTISDDDKMLLQARIVSAKKAINKYVSRLEEMQTSITDFKTPRLGKDLYFKKYELEVNAGFDAENIYSKALKEKAALHKQMITITDSIWDKYLAGTPKPADKLVMVKQLIDKISENHISKEEFVPEIRRQIPILTAFVNEHDLLTQDPTKPLVIRETPAYMRGGGAGASVSSPGPYESGKETYYNVSPLDDYTDEEAESYLREYNHYILQILNIHEAIPGHYTQLVYANKVPSVIKSVLSNGAMIEGWANYTELMMLEAGYENSPEMWLMRGKWHLRGVTNTLLDYSYHTLNLSKEEAMKLMVNDAFQQKTEAENKWRRLTLSSVQLSSYFTGFSQIYELREDLKVKEGDDFNLKAFHEKFLSYGNSPVRYIRELMMAE